MKKDAKSQKVLKAIAKALKTGLPISLLTLGLNSCKEEPGVSNAVTGTMPFKAPKENVSTGECVSVKQEDKAEDKAPQPNNENKADSTEKTQPLPP